MNPYLYVFLISMLPFIELRGAIPVGVLVLHLNPYLVFVVAVLGNMVLVPIFLLFLKDIERFLRKYPWAEKKMDWLFERTRRKSSESVRKWEYLALIIFVGIPLPGTGAWTGSLIAYLFGFEVKRAFVVIFMGVLMAGVIVMTATLGVNIFVP
ncbi:MAG: small multi-drug export protein [Euryarchaeota archaeon]|nr:small multi-drug export protein [Euryarchaeota archaeon]